MILKGSLEGEIAMRPPVVSGAQMLVGHGKEFFKSPIELLRRGHREHGEIFRLKLASKSMVVLVGPELHKFYFDETHHLLDIKKAYPFFVKMFSDRFFTFASKEEYMKQKNLLAPVFKASSLKDFILNMSSLTKDFIDHLGAEGELKVDPNIGMLVMKIATSSFIGRDFEKEICPEFYRLANEFSGGMEMVLPLWLPIPRLLKAKKAKSELHKKLSQWIQKRRLSPESDFFQNLIQSKYQNGEEVDEETIRNLTILLVWAGHETTAAQMTWVLADLLSHPYYIEKCRQEVDQLPESFFGENINLDQVEKLSYVDAVVRESERLHPVAFVQARFAKKDFQIKNFQILKGDCICIAPSVAQTSSKYYKAPLAFYPERYINGECTPDYVADPNQLIGFGGGINKCLGRHFARLEMKIILAHFVKYLDLELKESVVAKPGASTFKPMPYGIHFRKRKIQKSQVHDQNIKIDSISQCTMHQI